jgi:hypothetical protein
LRDTANYCATRLDYGIDSSAFGEEVVSCDGRRREAFFPAKFPAAGILIAGGILVVANLLQ